MKNLVLQHYEGTIPDYLEYAMDSVQVYAEDIGADYKVITGKPFDERLGLTAQKLAFTNEEYDEYDNVVIFDADIVIPDTASNVFELSGICQPNNHRIVRGQMYKGNREERKRLRELLTYGYIEHNFNVNEHKLDERAMHKVLTSYFTGWEINTKFQREVTDHVLYDEFNAFHFGPHEKYAPLFGKDVHDNRTLLEWQQRILPDMGQHYKKNRQWKIQNLRNKRNEWLDTLPKELTDGLVRVL